MGQEEDFGNWLMYFGTNRVAEKWSIHSEVQYRNHTIEPVNIEQLLLRTGINYHISSDAIVTLGYGYVASHDFESVQKEPESVEHRIFQQLILKNRISRVRFEHRYRIEQRWVNNKYRNRFRYRIMTQVPINNPSFTAGTFSLALYNEIFVNGEKVFFDRNRLYGALGYHFNEHTQLQLGYLRQRVNEFGKNYLQLAVIFNPDLRRRENE